jgi:hypothetical protein
VCRVPLGRCVAAVRAASRSADRDDFADDASSMGAVTIWCLTGAFRGSQIRRLDRCHASKGETAAMTSTWSRCKRWVFSRHSHPWSAWSRWATTPLIMVPIWNRNARQGAVVGAWFALNAVVFPPPRDDSAYATRVVLGEEMWVEERRMSGALAINGLTSGALLIAIDGARRHRLGQTTIATMGAMGSLLWYWREMARYYETQRGCP